MNNLNVLSLLFLIFLTASCNRNHFTSASIEEKTATHKTVAILPYDIEMQGRMPEKWDEQIKEEVLESESEMFQRSLINQILGSANRGRGNFRVNFQSVDKTRAILLENDFNHKTLKNKDPQELAKLLGVDAVFKVKLRKYRYLSNVESWGIDQGISILRNTTNLPVYVPSGVARTNDIDIAGSLVDVNNGEVLYSFSDVCGASWNHTPENIVEQVNRRIAKRFPYRIND